MSREQAFLWLAEVIMVAALCCFLRGYGYRVRDLARHMAWNKSGAALVAVGLLALEILVRVAGWEFPIRSRAFFLAHITVASLSFLVLIVLVVTGMRRIRRVHVAVQRLFFPLYLAAIVLSWFAFRLW